MTDKMPRASNSDAAPKQGSRRKRMSSHEAILKAMLQQRRAELTLRLRERRLEMQTEYAAAGCNKPLDESSDQVCDDLALTMIESTNRTIRLLDEALARLEQGAYGHCVDCGDAIAAARLSAMPFASRCRACEASREASTRNKIGWR